MYRQSERNLLNCSISSRCPDNVVNVGPLTAEISLPVWGTPTNFDGFRILASLLRRRSTEANQTLHDLWSSPGLVHYIYIFGAFAPPDGIFPRAKFTLRPSLAFSYIGGVSAWHSTSWPQPNFAVWYKELNYGTFADGSTYIWPGGHQVRHRPHSTSIFFLLSFFLAQSQPRNLDVCRTSTGGVALVRISDTGLKCTARGSLEMQDAKKSPKIAVWAPSQNFVGLYLLN